MGKGIILKSENRKSDPFLSMAVTVPMVEAAIGYNWVTALIYSLVAAVLKRIGENTHSTQQEWFKMLRGIALLLLGAHFLAKTSTVWPGRWSGYVVPAMLVMTAAYAVSKGTETAARSVSVLRYGMYTVLFALAISGVNGIKASALKPEWDTMRYDLMASMLLPVISKDKKYKTGQTLMIVLTVSILTAGKTAGSIYEYSKGLSIKGVTEHLESLAACAITMGWYGLMCMMLCAWKEETRCKIKGGEWLAALMIWLIGVQGWLQLGAICVVSEIMLWVIFPSMQELKNKWKKEEKSA